MSTPDTAPRWAVGKTMIHDYREVVELLKSSNVVALRGKEPVEGKILSERVINTLDGPEHVRRRRSESKLFTKDALAYFHRHALVPIVDTQFESITAAINSGQTPGVDLCQWMLTLLHRVAAEVSGIDDVHDPARVARFTVLIEHMMSAFTIEVHRGDVAEVIERAEAAKAEFRRDYLAGSLARRREAVRKFEEGSLTAEDLPRDIVTTMLLNWEDDWDEDLILREAMAFAQGSTRTSSRSAVHIVHHLLDWVSNHPEDRTLLTDVAFLQQAMFEALRLHPVVPALLRITTGPVELTSGRVVRAGERLAIMYGDASRDESIFGADANEFNPRRVISTPNTSPWGLAFGSGAHLCLGRRMATGSGSFGSVSSEATDSDGSLVYVIQRFFEFGLERDPDKEPIIDTTVAHYDAWAEYPVVFTKV